MSHLSTYTEKQCGLTQMVTAGNRTPNLSIKATWSYAFTNKYTVTEYTLPDKCQKCISLKC